MGLVVVGKIRNRPGARGEMEQACMGRWAVLTAQLGLEKTTERLPVGGLLCEVSAPQSQHSHQVLDFSVKGNGHGWPGSWRQRFWGLDLHYPREGSKES